MLLPLLYLTLPLSHAILYPYDTPTRQTKSLDGLWRFKLDPASVGHEEEWFKRALTGEDVVEMPVPSSYNDITTDASMRDYLGLAWYDRDFILPASWEDQNIVLRFGSVHYLAQVWVDGVMVGSHEGGHMAFEFQVSDFLDMSAIVHRVTVAVDNILTPDTVPQGNLVIHQDYKYLENEFDFFNYAGIHRPVVLYSTPRNIIIQDIDILAVFPDTGDLSSVTLLWDIKYQATQDTTCSVEIAHNSTVVARVECVQEEVLLEYPVLWWPVGMGHTPGHLYQVTITIQDIQTMEYDSYTIPYGVRKIAWDSDNLLVNNQPLYLHGIARHEDNIIRGKGFDQVSMVRDHHLMMWLGANSFRTSHYPYAEETLQLADRQGIVVISECAAVSLDGFSAKLLENHKTALTELYMRDRNHPSVVMWSVANEPRSFRPEAGPYFQSITQHLRSLDSSRPLTLILYDHELDITDYAIEYVDIAGINKYIGWYTDSGHLEAVGKQLITSLRLWRETLNKPIMITEYGCDTVAGLHALPDLMFTEEYQAEFLTKYWEVFDELKPEGWFVGEMPWVFSDFMTKQEVRRVAGNRKGLFTRDRQPKMAAHLVRRRYQAMITENTITHEEL